MADIIDIMGQEEVARLELEQRLEIEQRPERQRNAGTKRPSGAEGEFEPPVQRRRLAKREESEVIDLTLD